MIEEVDEREEKSVTVCDSAESARAWYVVAVEGRVLVFAVVSRVGSHL